MKYVIMALVLSLASPALADDRNGVREQYDDLMKASGKWNYISSSSVVFGLLFGAGSLYAYNRSLYYRSLLKERELDAHEAKEFETWDGVANHAGYTAAACFGFAIFGAAMEVRYENKAHAFALDMGVKF